MATVERKKENTRDACCALNWFHSSVDAKTNREGEVVPVLGYIPNVLHFVVIVAGPEDDGVKVFMALKAVSLCDLKV